LWGARNEVQVTRNGFCPSLSNSISSHALRTRAGDDLWIRNSIIAGLEDYPHNYYLKRITKCDGTKGEHWDDYLSHGANAAPSKADVFGFGADEREKVSDVHPTQLLSKKL
jgi:hypothetical protein